MLGLEAVSATWPLALAGLVGIPVLVLLHRRAARGEALTWSPAFLIRDGEGAGNRASAVRAPWLLALRIAALLALVALALGVFMPREGTLVLATGPFDLDPSWRAPVVVVRAGARPSQHDPTAPERVPAVESEPDWSAALAFGRARLASGPVVVPEERPRLGPVVLGAGADVTGSGRVAVSVDLESPSGLGAVLEDALGGRHALQGNLRLRTYEGALPSGGALVRFDDGVVWPLCVPDARPMPVAVSGFTTAFERGFTALEGLVRVPEAEAVWRARPLDPKQAPSSRWAPFAPDVTWVEVPTVPGPEPGAPLRPDGYDAAPGATVRGFHALQGEGRPAWWAGDAIVAQTAWSPEGRHVRLGFVPESSELVETASWPVWVAELVLASRADRSRCRRLDAGQTLEVDLPEGVRLVLPDGTRVPLERHDGRALLGPFDQRGLHVLEVEGGGARDRAWIAVEPPLHAPSNARPTLGNTAHRAMEVTPSVPLGLLALLCLGAAVVAAGRTRSRFAWVSSGLVVLALLDLRAPGGEAGTVVLAVDTSASVPSRALATALAEVEGALGTRVAARVEGDDRVRETVGAGTEAPESGRATRTRLGPILRTAATLAGSTGVVVLLTDGRAADLPHDPGVPVVVVPVESSSPDVVALSGRARRLGEQIFVEAILRGSGAVRAEWEIDRVAREVDLAPGRDRRIAATVRLPPGLPVVVRVHATGDPETANDLLKVPVGGEVEALAQVLGRADSAPFGWLRQAGFTPVPLEPSDLVRVAPAPVLWVHDLPASALTAEATEALTTAVRAGSMLVLSGRGSAFGAAGWASHPLDALSPLGAAPRAPGRARVGVVLLLDRSGSMSVEAGGVGPAGLAQITDGVTQALRVGTDGLAVVAFGGAAEVLRPFAPVGKGGPPPVPSTSSGGTRLTPALLEACRLLTEADVDARVVVVVSDGAFADSEADLEAAVAAALRAEVRLFGVAVGAERDASTLDTLSRRLGGSVVEANPGDAVRATMQATQDAVTDGGLFLGPQAVLPGAAWAARVGGSTGQVEGAIRTEARPAARVLARLAEAPLVAEWALGAGRVVALATDAWSAPEGVWRRLLAPARRAPTQGPRVVDEALLERRFVVETGTGNVPPTARVEDVTGAALAVTVRRVGGRVFEVQVAPDVGVGGAPATLLLEADGEQSRHVFVLGHVRELVERGPDGPRLEATAALSGGSVVRSASLLPSRVDALLGREPGAPLFAVFALLALLTLLVDTGLWARVGRS